MRHYIILSAALLFCATFASAQSSQFTFQGRIVESGAPVNGNHTLTFKLYGAETGGTELGSNTVNVTVTNGIFTTILDFGATVFDGNPRFIEIIVGPNILSPRQKVTSTPYAVRANDTAALNGVPAINYVQTTDSRLSDARTPTAGSGSYIQNQNGGQQTANFSISGNGNIGGNASVGGGLAVDADTLVVDSVNDRVGIGTTTPSNTLSLGGENVRFFGMERRTAPDSPGHALFLEAGGASSGGTNGLGGSLVLRSGVSTGNAGSSIEFQTPTAGGSGSGDNFFETRMTVSGNGVGIGTFPFADRQLYIQRFGLDNSSNFGLFVSNITSSNNTTVMPAKYGAHISNSGSMTGSSYGLNIENTTTNTVTNGRVKYGLNIYSDGTFTGSAGPLNFNYGLSVHAGGADVNYAATFTGGNVGIGTSFPANILTVQNGSATDPIADAWTTYSSRRWKTGIRTLEGSLDKVRRLRGVSYTTKAEGKADIGLIAEEVGEVVPEVVTYEENGVDAKSVDYARLTALLIEAVKEQQKQIDVLKKLLCAQNAQAEVCKEGK